MTRTQSLLSHLPSRSLLCAALLGVLLPACKKEEPAKPLDSEFGTVKQAILPPRAPLSDADGKPRADAILGQVLATTNALNYAEARSTYSPGQMALDTSVSPPRLFLADTLNNRVLAWADAKSYATGAPADRVFGFETFDQGSDYGAAHGCKNEPVQGSLCRPAGVVVDGAGNLYVADTDNHRVVEYDAPFAADPVAAWTPDRFFGQASWSVRGCNLAGLSESSLCNPVSVALDVDGNLYVADKGNSRVLRYDKPLVNGTVADYVLGQSSFTTNVPAFPEDKGFRSPGQLAVDRANDRVWVADTANNRVLGFSATAFATGESPSVVLGQADFTSVAANTPSLSASSLKGPTGVAVDSAGNVYVADRGNHRVLAYVDPFTTDTVADKVWGQGGSFSGAASGTSETALSSPAAVHVNAAGELLVADSNNNRVLLFVDAANPAADTSADRVWGQQGSFTTKVCNLPGRATADSLCDPRAVTTDADGDLYIADYDNHRVLRFAGQTDTTADQVFGQVAMEIASCNYGGLSANTLCSPSSVAVTSDGTLWVGDSDNHRAVAYRSAKATDAVADLALGRPDLGAAECTRTSATCYEDSNVTLALDAGDNLFVSLEHQNRVLRYENPLAVDKDLVPEAVLGQQGFAGQSRNFADPAALDVPVAVAVDRSVTPNRLYVVDEALHRISVWHSVAFANGSPAQDWIGQVDGSSASAGAEVADASSLYKPSHCAVDAAGNLYVADGENNRVLVFNAPFQTGGDRVADTVVGQASMDATACNGGAAPSASTLCQPSGVLPSSDGTTLWVSDRGNHRVLRFDGFPADRVADAALGQTAMNLHAANLADAMSVYEPQGVAIDRSVSPNRVFVADTQNSRVLGWSNLDALSGGNPADVVLGQVDFHQVGCNNGGLSSATLCTPTYVRVDGQGRLWVSDAGNHRVLMYGNPFGGEKAATRVLGQPDFTRGEANQGGLPTAATLRVPRGIDVDPSGNVWVADTANHRVLLFLDPVATDTLADKIIGQPDMLSGLCNQGNNAPSSLTLCEPAGLRVDTTVSPYGLWIADYLNDRVMRYDGALAGDVLPDQLLGQTSYTTPAPSTKAASSSKIVLPVDVAADHAGNLYVSDEDPDRVIVFNNVRAPDGVGDRMFGQTSYTRRACNQAAQTAADLICGPSAIDFDEYGGLWLADRNNNRVLAYFANTIPAASRLEVGPASPFTGDDLQLTYDFVDPENDLESGTVIRWFRNGVEVESLRGAKTVPALLTAREESWHATVQPMDGRQYGAVATSPAVTVRNSLPVVALAQLSPAAPTTVQDLVASYSFSDDDGDANSGSTIRWFRNNTEQPLLRDTLVVPGSDTVKNDVWYFEVTPSDGTDFGLLVRSEPVQIRNSPPVAANAQVFPAAPRVTDSLTATYTYSDLDDDAQLGPEIRWYRNGVLESAFNDFMTVPGPFVYGEQWHFVIRPRDGVTFGDPVSSPVAAIVSSPPVASALQITPFSPGTGDALTANYSFSDPDGQEEAGGELRWFRNGTEMSELLGARVVPASETTKGDQWYFTLRPSDGELSGAMKTSPVAVIGNTLPVVLAPVIAPAEPTTVDALTSSYTFDDSDGDLEQGSETRWFKNGIEQPAYAGLTQLPASATQKRDVWFYRVRPHDGEGFGDFETSSPAYIKNSPPAASAGADRDLPATGELTRVELDGSASSDLDGDVLAYTWRLGTTIVGTGETASVELPIGEHVLTLAVSDGEATATDEQRVTVGDPAPAVTVSDDFQAWPGRVELPASATDLLGRPVSYAWSQVVTSAEDPMKVEIFGADRATASFFALKAGPRTFKLVATAGGAQTEKTVTVTTLDLEPIARVPARNIVKVGEPARLEAPESIDPNGEPLTYQWSLVAGPSTQGLMGLDQPAASFTAPADGLYSVRLVVNDGVHASQAAVLQVLAVDPQVTSHAPVADAGADGSGEIGVALPLDGTRSYDVDGDALTFEWKQISGPAGKLSSAEAATASFVPGGAGTVEFSLKVTDAKGQFAEDSVAYVVLDTRANRRPIARVAEVSTVVVGSAVQLDGSRSSDPEGDPLTYAWSQLEGGLGGVPVKLAGATQSIASFTVTRPGRLAFQLVVSDAHHASVPVLVTLYATEAGNALPVANAGPDQQVTIGGTVQLDATGSSDLDEGTTLRHVWEQVLGAPVLLSGDAAAPTFTPRGRGLYRFRLTVWDEQAPSVPDEVDVIIGTHGADNKTPVAVVGAATSVAVGEEVILDGTASHDPDPLDQLTYRWRLVGFPTGAEPTLSSAVAAKASFVPSAAGAYSFALVVSDGDLESAPAYLTITVSGGEAAGCSTVGSGPQLGLLGLGLVLARGLFRKRKTVAER